MKKNNDDFWSGNSHFGDFVDEWTPEQWKFLEESRKIIKKYVTEHRAELDADEMTARIQASFILGYN